MNDQDPVSQPGTTGADTKSATPSWHVYFPYNFRINQVMRMPVSYRFNEKVALGTVWWNVPCKMVLVQRGGDAVNN